MIVKEFKGQWTFLDFDLNLAPQGSDLLTCPAMEIKMTLALAQNLFCSPRQRWAAKTVHEAVLIQWQMRLQRCLRPYNSLQPGAQKAGKYSDTSSMIVLWIFQWMCQWSFLFKVVVAFIIRISTCTFQGPHLALSMAEWLLSILA